MLNKSIILKFYKQEDIQKELVKHAENKEIGMQYGLNNFGKRPDILSYPRDVIELALRGLTSFHASEERWSSPISLNSNLSKQELNELRIGWDLVLDIDCAVFEYSRICGDLIVKFLKYCGVEDVSCKFSGNKGMHIGVPFEAFPKEVSGKLTKDLFPEAPKRIAFYIKENIKEELGKRILEFENNNFSEVKTKVKMAEIVRYENNTYGDKIAKLNVDKFLEIDTVLISSRHLYRMPYSLHEKSGLVSLPIDPDKVLEFEKVMAKPESVFSTMFPFLDRNVKSESARRLLVQALDFEVKLEEERETPKEFEEIEITSPIREEFFPPCMKLALQGMQDGKKRVIFIMTNFLGKLGWGKNEVEQYLKTWNSKKNPEPLREVYIKGQLNNFKPGEKLPPNCSNESYYPGLGICKPDGLCKRIKNPVNYSLLKWKSWLRDNEEENKQKEFKEKQKTKQSPKKS
jgi:DNA primase catalytic subunit